MCSMDKIYIFNPETDFALAHGGEYYTPNRRITQLKNKLSLLPAIYADAGSNILVPDKTVCASPVIMDAVKRKELTVIEPAEVSRLADRPVEIYPWGWNPALRRMLINLGISESYLPDTGYMAAVKRLSHRRQTIEWHKRINALTGMNTVLPKELSDYDEVLQWCDCHQGGYLKAPWSSSGRGIFRALNTDGQELKTWIRGTLHRQQSVMVEENGGKVLDFATEWNCHSGSAQFIGFSVFSTDAHSQYTGNIFASQEQLLEMIRTAANDKWSDEYISIQKQLIEALIAPSYCGPMGVDCMVCEGGRVNLCVEINLRMTMGHVAIAAIADGINPAEIV